ncbi:hypothetical protein GCM10025876_09630 [Demequina litorisediminis]|uniref:Uncharacterized protein n=1 Tax=Demequina litorisediminis TaxID=1849022 RepID=A0ABQ6IAR6_9MICO|nr:hypothetical protein GCM10025876_09630 [Demequina litorisediminis]
MDVEVSPYEVPSALYRYLLHHLRIVCVISSTMLLRSGRDEDFARRVQMWKEPALRRSGGLPAPSSLRDRADHDASRPSRTHRLAGCLPLRMLGSAAQLIASIGLREAS